MKHIILAIAFAILPFILHSKEVMTNNETGTKLSETLGIYSISNKSGTLILGNLQSANQFFYEAEKMFIKKAINSIFSVDDNQYEIKSDEYGLYLIRIGFGTIKIRHIDTAKFLIYTSTKIVKDKMSRAYNELKK